MTHTVDVPAIRLDDYLTGKDGRVDLVKIDTEGAEGFILAGEGAQACLPIAHPIEPVSPGKCNHNAAMHHHTGGSVNVGSVGSVTS